MEDTSTSGVNGCLPMATTPMESSIHTDKRRTPTAKKRRKKTSKLSRHANALKTRD
jgi:hypothetical protein